jgi:hypothetical protein
MRNTGYHFSVRHPGTIKISEVHDCTLYRCEYNLCALLECCQRYHSIFNPSLLRGISFRLDFAEWQASRFDRGRNSQAYPMDSGSGSETESEPDTTLVQAQDIPESAASLPISKDTALGVLTERVKTAIDSLRRVDISSLSQVWTTLHN